jgi:hypothetical protein
MTSDNKTFDSINIMTTTNQQIITQITVTTIIYLLVTSTWDLSPEKILYLASFFIHELIINFEDYILANYINIHFEN